MVLDRRSKTNDVIHTRMDQLTRFVEPGTVMVFNDTRVRKARMFARNTETGGRGEFLFLAPTTPGGWECIVDKARKKRIGQQWEFPGGILGTVYRALAEDCMVILLNPPPDESWFEVHGHVPLPPYMRRPDGPEDIERYQTVYAKYPGSAAAPTAGLHFTQRIMEELTGAGVLLAWVTLQVGLGTFAPVRSEIIADHSMHMERYSVPAETASLVEDAKHEGRTVLAVGTTSVRTLEAAWNGTNLESGEGSTDLFIYPGYRFRVVDALFTNFHTPRSSLLILVSAFYERERLLEAYRIAVEEEYRFFSYGDAMLIL